MNEFKRTSPLRYAFPSINCTWILIYLNVFKLISPFLFSKIYDNPYVLETFQNYNLPAVSPVSKQQN